MPSSTHWWSDALIAVEPGDGWLPGAFNRGWSYRDRVGPEAAGIGLIAYYSARYRHSSAALWQQRLERGEIHRNGTLARRDLELRAGDRLLWQRPPWWEEPVPAELPIRFDDGDLLVVDKPSGLPVLPAGGWLEHTALRLLERRHQGDPAGLPRPVHRLGRFTSGLLVCARRPASRAWLSAQLRDSTAELPPADGNQGPSQPEASAPSARLPCSGSRALEAAAERTERRATPCSSVPEPSERRGLAGSLAAPPPAPPPRDRSPEAVASRRAAGQGRGGFGDQDLMAPALASAAPPRGPVATAGRGARKIYRALLPTGALEGAPGASWAIQVPIGRHPHPRLGWVWAAGGEGALPARSLLSLLETRPDGDLVEVEIQSGRPHQIRIHCAALGAPLLGDPLYLPGGVAHAAALPGAGGYQLHALALRLRRPDGAGLDLWAPPPPSLRWAGDSLPGSPR